MKTAPAKKKAQKSPKMDVKAKPKAVAPVKAAKAPAKASAAPKAKVAAPKAKEKVKPVAKDTTKKTAAPIKAPAAKSAIVKTAPAAKVAAPKKAAAAPTAKAPAKVAVVKDTTKKTAPKLAAVPAPEKETKETATKKVAAAKLKEVAKEVVQSGKKEAKDAKGNVTPIAAPLLKKEPKAKKVKAIETKETLMQRALQLQMICPTVCTEMDCDGLIKTTGYCRMHYIRNWKKIKRKEEILKDGRLQRYIEELVAKYPEKYIDAIRTDLSNDKDFFKVVRELELDESLDDVEGDDDGVESIIGSIRKDIETDDDSFF